MTETSQKSLPRGPLEKISRLIGSTSRADRLLRKALAEASLDEWPADRDARDAFVRGILAAVLLPYLRLDLLQDVIAELIDEETTLVTPQPLRALGALSGGLPSDAAKAAQEGRRARIALFEPDALRRAELSRAMLGASFEVEVLENLAQVEKTRAPHAIVCAIAGDARVVLTRIAKTFTRTGLVVLDDPSARVDVVAVVNAWRAERVARVPRLAPPAQVCARIRVVLP